LPGASWDEWAKIRDRSRETNAEGLMLKRLDASYEVGRVRGAWWKWKVSPYTIDAVLIYAQKGHGKRSGLYTDYTFALWEGDTLVPFAKAYSGLDDSEIKEVDKFVRQNTRESFGPVRSVAPALVMEIAFEGLQRSPRHKSGIATRFPRIVRWRHDKKPEDANSLAELIDLLPSID
jgi:DNA ligase-1